MTVTNKTSELATIIVNQLEISRLDAEKIDPESGKIKFTIKTTAPNMIETQVPKAVQKGDYAETIYCFIIAMINETGYKLTEQIAIHLYCPGQEHIKVLTLTPKSKDYLN